MIFFLNKHFITQHLSLTMYTKRQDFLNACLSIYKSISWTFKFFKNSEVPFFFNSEGPGFPYMRSRFCLIFEAVAKLSIPASLCVYWGSVNILIIMLLQSLKEWIWTMQGYCEFLKNNIHVKLILWSREDTNIYSAIFIFIFVVPIMFLSQNIF